MTASMFILGRRRGRPPRAGVRSTERISFALTAEERAALKVVADENQLKVAEVVREAVNSFVSDYSDRGGPFARATFGGPMKPSDE